MTRRTSIGHASARLPLAARVLGLTAALTLALACHATPALGAIAALNVAEGATGSQPFGGDLGYTFTVLDPIHVTQLGAFDSGANGFSNTITVNLWRATATNTGPQPGDVFASAGTLITSTTIGPAQGSAAGSGTGFVYRDIPATTLLPGVYVVTGGNFVGADPNGNTNTANPPAAAVDANAGPDVRFGATGFNATAGNFPSSGDSYWSAKPGQYLAGSFAYEQNDAAYLTNTGTAGNQNFGGSLGMDFQTNRPVRVTDLGAFDHLSDGINGPVTVHLYYRDENQTAGFGDDTGQRLATLTFNGSGDALVGGHRFASLSGATFYNGFNGILPAGFNGTIVAEGYNAAELVGNSGAGGGPYVTDSGDGALTFEGSSRFGTAGLFPGTPDGGPANRYNAGSFRFTESAAGGGGLVPIRILNPSFEQDTATILASNGGTPLATTPGGFINGVVPEWTDNFAPSPNAGLFHVPGSEPTAPDGNIALFINADGYVVQNLELESGSAVTADPGREITIAFLARMRDLDVGSIRVDLRALPNTSVTIPVTVDIPATTDWEYLTATFLINDAATLGALLGDPIFLVFDNPIGGQVLIDSVWGVTTVPAPAALPAGLLALGSLALRRRRTLRATA